MEVVEPSPLEIDGGLSTTELVPRVPIVGVEICAKASTFGEVEILLATVTKVSQGEEGARVPLVEVAPMAWSTGMELSIHPPARPAALVSLS